MTSPTALDLFRNAMTGVGIGTILFFVASLIGHVIRWAGDDRTPTRPIPPVHEEIHPMPDPLNHDPIGQALRKMLADADKARATAMRAHPAGKTLRAVPNAKPAPPVTLHAVLTLVAVVAQNVMAASALAKLATRLHELGAPVPALTYRQAAGLWSPAAVLVGAIAYRAHGATIASRRQADKANAMRAARRKAAQEAAATATKVSA